MADPAILRATDATVSIDNTILLAPVSLSVQAGEIWALSGQNGSGKTTLLRSFLDSSRLTSGTCCVLGQPASIAQKHQRGAVSALVDPIPIARDMTIEEQILLVAASWYGNTERAKETANSTLAQLNLVELANRFAHQVSAGQLQLFNLALTLARPAQVVLLDEPERHLDDAHIALLLQQMKQRSAKGTAFLVATHEPTLIEGSDCRLVLS